MILDVFAVSPSKNVCLCKWGLSHRLGVSHGMGMKVAAAVAACLTSIGQVDHTIIIPLSSVGSGHQHFWPLYLVTRICPP